MLRATICLGGALLLMTAHSYAADVHEYRLDNGLLVLLKENHNAPVINFNVVYRVGSKYERPGITGISHLLEHMMFKTTKNLELGEFDRRLKEVGSDNNAYTWLDQTVYYETIAAGKIDVALELEAERMRYLLCLPEDHELEMPVVRNELEQRDDSPFTLLSEELFANAFKAHPYRVPTIGWVDDVESITSEEIKAHYDRYYNPDNAFLVLVGDFEPDEMYAKIQRHFGGIPSGDVRLPRISKEPEQIGERRFEIRKAGQLDFILAGWHIPESEHPDSYALVVLGNILGEGRTSRLYRALVDTGKCAAAGAWSSAFGFADPFLFLVNGVVSPGETPAGVEPIYYEEIEKIITGGVTDEELARARKQARVSFVFEKDSIVSEARSLVSFELMSGWRDLDNYLPGIEAVTNDDLMRVAAKYLTKQNRTVGIWHAIRPEGEDGGGDGGGEPTVPEGEENTPQVGPPNYRHPGQSPYSSKGLPNLPLPGREAAVEAEVSGELEYATVTELSNGLTVVVHENHNNATVNINGLVRAGKIDDPPGLPGVGHFAVAMLANGTEQHSKLELAEILEGAGIELGFNPSRESFSFSGRSLSEDFELMLEMLAEQLLKPAFPEEEVEKTRQQILAGLLDSYNDTFAVSFYASRDMIYGAEHPFAGRVEGTPESVEAITRGDLVDWYESKVIPQGAVITIVGDVDAAEALRVVKRRFQRWRGKNPHRSELIERGSEFKEIAGERREISLPDKSNVSLLWIGPGVSKRGDGWTARIIANFIFGGDFYSRLNERLRVKEGLTYGSFCWYSNGLAAGPFCVSAQVNPANIEPAIAAAQEEMALIAAEGITDDELALAKSYLTGNFPVKLATNGAVAAALTDAVYMERGVDYIHRYLDLVSAVTKEEVNAEVKGFSPDQLSLVLAGTLP